MPLPFLTAQPFLARLRAGDAEALTAAYHEHGSMVFTLAQRITGSRADAEDVLHDVFLSLPGAASGYEERGQFPAWLRRLTVRTSLMQLRRKRRRAEVMLPESVPLVGSTESAAVARLDLAAAVGRLPEVLRVVFVLKVIEGYSHEEIAGLLDIRRGASEMRLTRAIRQLRQFLEASR